MAGNNGLSGPAAAPGCIACVLAFRQNSPSLHATERNPSLTTAQPPGKSFPRAPSGQVHGGIVEDKEVAAVVAGFQADAAKQLERVVGHTAVDLEGRSGEVISGMRTNAFLRCL